MFEAEEQIESRSYLLHLVIVVVVIVAVAGGLVYYYVKQQKPLTSEQASAVITDLLNSRASSIVHFSVGNVTRGRQDDPTNPQYKLLESAGFIKTRPGAGGAVQVTVTPLGASTFSQFPEFAKKKNSDGTEGYTVPLAKREFATVTRITPTGPSTATVEYTWKWAPNAVGEVFDANGKLMQQFNTWQRQSLIQKFGADFYHGQPTGGKVKLIRADRKTWKIATD
jgi:hypothetical protein